MKRTVLAICLSVCGAALVTLGLVLGWDRDVWLKAIRVCLECIGIG